MPGPQPAARVRARDGLGAGGPLARRAGHDLTYLALTGALAAIGPADGDPVPPLNLVADYGGGSLFLLVGVLAALVERGVTGRGQVVDAAMVDGATSLLALTYTLFGAGLWRLERGANLLDGGAPYYATYRCSDGGHVAVAALEERFWVELVRVLDLDLSGLGPREEPATWPELRARLAATFATRARDHWAELFAPLDACVAPVLTLAETLEHPQLGGRGTVTRSAIPGMAGATEPGPAPRFSRTPASAGSPPRPAGADTLAALVDWGLPEPTVRDLLARGIAVQPDPTLPGDHALPSDHRQPRPGDHALPSDHAAAGASAGRHPDGAVQADRLAVEHRVLTMCSTRAAYSSG